MVRLSPGACCYLCNYKDLMLEQDPQQKMEESGILPFTDPALRTRRARTALAARLFAAGMLTPVMKVRGRMHPFTVVKKIIRSPLRQVNTCGGEPQV